MTDAGSRRNCLGSLSIKGFRGIDQLDIPRLGRVALLAGRNGVGKTTVLDAVRVYAAPGELESFVAELVPDDDPVWSLAERYVDGISSGDRQFPPDEGDAGQAPCLACH